jgi:hypothetical protein
VTINIVAQISELQSMDSAQLRAKWKDLFGTMPPQVNRNYLQRRLAYRIQELALGGDPFVDKRLEALSQRRQDHSRKDPRMMKPLAGSRLVRQYKGMEYHVTVLPDGFEYKGMRFKSLTRIACDITGTWTSGPAFFGLTNRNKGGVK